MKAMKNFSEREMDIHKGILLGFMLGTIVTSIFWALLLGAGLIRIL